MLSAERWQPDMHPIGGEEVPYLERLGAELRALKVATGLRWVDLAYGTLVSAQHLTRLACGLRRTRRETLEHFAAAVVEARPDLGPADLLADHLCDIAGPALAGPSKYQARIDRRLASRERKRDRGQWKPDPWM